LLLLVRLLFLFLRFVLLPAFVSHRTSPFFNRWPSASIEQHLRQQRPQPGPSPSFDRHLQTDFISDQWYGCGCGVKVFPCRDETMAAHPFDKKTPQPNSLTTSIFFCQNPSSFGLGVTPAMCTSDSTE
jgi:hypothetical protein